MRFLFFPLFTSLGINAQNVSPARIQSLHHADIFLCGAGYTYEYAFAPRVSAGGRISLLPTIRESFRSDEVYRGIYPFFSVDTRRYGNFAKRLAKGKNTGLNSANFRSLLLEYVPDCALRRQPNDSFHFSCNTSLGFKAFISSTFPF